MPKRFLTSQSSFAFIGFSLLIVVVVSFLAWFFFIQVPAISHSQNKSQIGAGFWHTEGTQLLDQNNHPVRITGINWFGFETNTYVVHGLDKRNYKDLLQQIKNLHYNTIRLPYANQLFDQMSKPTGINFSLNPDLRTLTGLQIMDKIVNQAGQLGLHIILDQHRPDVNAQSPLWYTATYSETRWLADWQMLAKHYLGNTTILGADLHNEPHNPACWGCGDPTIDWKMAAERGGNAILHINPHWLIFVEGVECYGAGGSTIDGECSGWGSNLRGVQSAPVKLAIPHQLVYSAHDYPASVAHHPWFDDPGYPANLPAVWDSYWGYIQKQGLAPVWLGEFGSRLEQEQDRQWFNQLLKYLGTGSGGFNWSYWSLNPDSSDTGGLLQDDWKTVNQQKQQALAPLQFSLN